MAYFKETLQLHKEEHIFDQEKTNL